jgi:hypothetical protein
MVVEHEFVTVIPAERAMQTVIDFLVSRGFIASPVPANPQTEPLRHDVDLQRPAGKLGKWTVILPQRLRLEYDRGRVAMAFSVSPDTDWKNESRRRFFGGRPTPSVVKEQADLLITEACAVEALLADGRLPEQCAAAWVDAESTMTDAARETQRRLFRNKMIVLGAIAAFVVTLAGMAIAKI